jgi:YD repeat-containing protein
VNLYNPVEEYILENALPSTNILESHFVNFDEEDFNNHKLIFNRQYQKRITYNNYDTYGNPIFITKDSLENIVYLWGYKGQYPIAEIKNASYSDVTGKIPVATLDAITAKNEPSSSDWTTINNLRTNLISAMVTTYTYKPLVGMTSKTDPRGFTIYYDYDAFGRLKGSYFYENSVKKVLETYDYHYKDQ